MRTKVALPLLLAGILAVLLAFMFRSKNPAAHDPVAPAAITAGGSTQKTRITQRSPMTSDKDVPQPAAAEASVNEENENYAAGRITELGNLGMTGDSNSLVEIESEFDNRDPQIQQAAVAAAVQFGSRDAIPSLQEAYRHFDDPGTKLNLQEAIDFLELPTLAETGSP